MRPLLERGEARGDLRGRLAEARALVLRLGPKRFGPSPEAEGAVANIADRDCLGRLAGRSGRSGSRRTARPSPLRSG